MPTYVLSALDFKIPWTRNHNNIKLYSTVHILKDNKDDMTKFLKASTIFCTQPNILQTFNKDYLITFTDK